MLNLVHKISKECGLSLAQNCMCPVPTWLDLVFSLWSIVILVFSLLNQITLQSKVTFHSPAEEIFVSVSVIFLHFTGNSFNIAFFSLPPPCAPPKVWGDPIVRITQQKWVDLWAIYVDVSHCSHWRRNREGQLKQQMEQRTSHSCISQLSWLAQWQRCLQWVMMLQQLEYPW